MHNMNSESLVGMYLRMSGRATKKKDTAGSENMSEVVYETVL